MHTRDSSVSINNMTPAFYAVRGEAYVCRLEIEWSVPATARRRKKEGGREGGDRDGGRKRARDRYGITRRVKETIHARGAPTERE